MALVGSLVALDFHIADQCFRDDAGLGPKSARVVTSDDPEPCLPITYHGQKHKKQRY
jgi:hypothetical protein